MKDNQLKKLIGGVSAALIVVIIALNSFTICNVGEECTATAFGKIAREDMTGFNIVPFWYDIKVLNIQDQSWSFNDMGVPSQDKFKTSMDVSFNGQFNSLYGGEITTNVGSPAQFLSTHVNKPMRSCVIKAGTDVENSQMFFEKTTQQAMASSSLSCINNYLDNLSEVGGAFSVTEVRFSDINLDTKVQAMIVMTKERQEAENRQESALRIKDLEAQEVQVIAAANKIAASDNKEAAILVAEGVKQAMILEAEGNEKLAKSITTGLADYVKAKAWNGVLPTHQLGSNTSMFLK